MSSGCQIFAADQSVIFDTADQTIKFLGLATVGFGGTDTATGTITDARFTALAGHEPFYVEREGGSGSNLHYAARWTFSGNNLSWSFPTPSIRPRTRILYGVAGVAL